MHRVNSHKNIIQVSTFNVNDHLHVKEPPTKKRKLYKKSEVNKYTEPVSKSYCVQQKPIAHRLDDDKFEKSR